MKAWLRATHGPVFELARHFIRRFFDSDLSAGPAEISPVMIGTFVVFLQWFLVLAGPLSHKYQYLAKLPSAAPYRDAARADTLILITLMMAVIGLLTAFKWQALFPDLRDYRALAGLPLRSRQIFTAKLLSLLLIAAALLLTLNLLPSLMLPALTGGRWALQPSLSTRIYAQAVASLAGCAFFFFAILALQGTLLNILRPQLFGRVTSWIQALLLAAMLAQLFLSFSIQPQLTHTALQAQWARWLPPIWFLGLHQQLSGVTDPAIHALATRAINALALAVFVAFLTYAVSYSRHRTLLIEGPPEKRTRWLFGDLVAACLSRNPRRQAITAFMMQTLARSNHHRTILLGYCGLVLALFLTGAPLLARFVEPSHQAASNFVYYHILALLFLSIGVRHIFALPTELKANWVFQITEFQGRNEWLEAVDRFVWFWGALFVIVLPLPLEIRLLGVRGIMEATLFLLLGLFIHEWSFFSWNKLPFTCSHLQGKTPIGLILGFSALIGILGLTHSALLAILYSPLAFPLVIAALLLTWLRIRHLRRQSWSDLQIKYQEAFEPEIHSLNLGH